MHMLLVDRNRRRVESVRREQLQRPFVPVSGLQTIDDARGFLCLFRYCDADLRHALATEMTSAGCAALHQMGDAELITAAAREIAARRLPVGCLLPQSPVLLFDDHVPWGGSFDNVAFPSSSAASTLVAALRTDRRAVEAVDHALAYEGAPSLLRRGRATGAPSPTAGADGIPDEVAGLLANGTLLLVPVGATPLATTPPAFRLAWRRGATSGSIAGRAWDAVPRRALAAPPRFRTPPPPQRLPSAPASTGRRSTLPKPPPSNSRQVRTLIAAARSGVPFCEECKPAAARA
jgi:hypothetical protein